MQRPIIPLIVGSVIALAVCTVVSMLTLSAAAPRPAVPLDPIDEILKAFRSHRIVALGEGHHGNEQSYAFRLSLIRDRRFAAIVNDVVVESGNARYQEVIDRFVRGESVPEVALRKVWENTTQATAVWDKPIYEEFFRAVRDANSEAPPRQKLRVLLGDPPIDWDEVHTDADYFRLVPTRGDDYPVGVIRAEVLNRHRRALVVYGEGHLTRRNLTSVVGRLENAASTPVFSVLTATDGDAARLQENVTSWRVPSLAMLHDTVLGAVDYNYWFGGPIDPPHVTPTEAQFDALLYVGRPSDMVISPLPPARCADPAYWEMRLGRMALLGDERDTSDRLTAYCGGLEAK